LGGFGPHLPYAMLNTSVFDSSLDSAISLKTLPKFFGQALGMWFIIGLIVNIGMTPPTFLPMAGLFVIMSFYRPKAFLYLVIAFFFFRETFDLQQIFSSWGVNGGFGQGRGFLSFLRFVHPGTPTTYQMPKVIWGAMLLRIGIINRKQLSLNKITRLQGLIYGFVIISLLSGFANLALDKVTFRFIVVLTLPFVTFFYIKTFRLTRLELQMLFGFIIFCGLEMQVFFNFVNNWEHAIHFRIFFGDDGIGTFKHPRYEVSAYFMTFAFFLFLYRFLINRKLLDLFRCMLAFYGVLSVSVILFTVLLMAFTLFSFLYAYISGIIKPKELAIAMFAAAVLGGLVAYQLQRDAGTAAHLDRHMNKNDHRSWWEVPKIYSFVNLYNMMDEEGKWLLGVGPGRFLTIFGHGYYQAKYNSYAVFKTTQLSSSERLENSTVGIIGEVGLFGYLMLILAYYSFFQQLMKRNLNILHYSGKPEASYTMVIICMLFFMALSLIRNSLEEITLHTVLMIFVSLVYQFEWRREMSLEEARKAREEPKESTPNVPSTIPQARFI